MYYQTIDPLLPYKLLRTMKSRFFHQPKLMALLNYDECFAQSAQLIRMFCFQMSKEFPDDSPHI